MTAAHQPKARGIPFSAPMVRALLETPPRKSQTRRLVRAQDRLRAGVDDLGRPSAEYLNRFGSWQPWVPNAQTFRCPYGVPGDLLYVREAWTVHRAFDSDAPRDLIGTEVVRYAADDARWESARSRRSIHMPKWAARLWLEIVEVRCQRLQEISEEDARAEGVDPLIPGHGPVTLDELRCDPGMRTPSMYRDGFSYTWSELRDKPAEFGKSWRENPWVWAITFKPADPVTAALLRERLKERRRG